MVRLSGDVMLCLEMKISRLYSLYVSFRAAVFMDWNYRYVVIEWKYSLLEWLCR
jgi:hypothetical protein